MAIVAQGTLAHTPRYSDPSPSLLLQLDPAAQADDTPRLDLSVAPEIDRANLDAPTTPYTILGVEPSIHEAHIERIYQAKISDLADSEKDTKVFYAKYDKPTHAKDIIGDERYGRPLLDRCIKHVQSGYKSDSPEDFLVIGPKVTVQEIEEAYTSAKKYWAKYDNVAGLVLGRVGEARNEMMASRVS